MNKQLEFFNNKKANVTSKLEGIIYTEAIDMINGGVNGDKVNNWVNNIISTFNNKPKPLSDKEKQIREQKLEQKRNRKEEKKKQFELFNIQMKDLFDEYSVFLIGFFGYKELSDSEYNLFASLVKKNDYFIVDIGDGAFEPFITKKKLDDTFFKKYDYLRNELLELDTIKNILDDYLITDIDNFRKKIIEIV